MRRPLLAVLLLASPVWAEVRYGSFPSASLGRDVAYAVDEPPSCASHKARCGVVYVLHGLFESHAFWEKRGLSEILRGLSLRAEIPEVLVVVVDGDNSFFLNGPLGCYEDLVTKDLIAHVEKAHSVVNGAESRALLGISMGGHAALRIAFRHPELYRAVASHSAMLLSTAPSPEKGVTPWHMKAFQRAFGDPIDPTSWSEADPLTWARRVDPRQVPALFVDCGAEDRYGLAAGHRQLHTILESRGVSHEFDLPPGDHGYEYVRSVLPRSLRFLGKALILPANEGAQRKTSGAR